MGKRIEWKRIAALLVSVVILSAVLAGCSAKGSKTEHITSLEQLTDQNIGVVTAMFYEQSLLKTNPDVKIQYYSTATDLVLALEQGRIDGCLIEDVAYQMFKREFPWLRLLDGVVETTWVGVAVSDSEPVLREQVNDFVAENAGNGLFGQMRQYWVENFDEGCRVDKSGITGENGKISVGIESTYMPYSYIADGELQGLDVDLLYRFCRAYGYEPELYAVNCDAIPMGVDTGKFDLGMNVFLSEERGEHMSISEPYEHSDVFVAVAGDKEDSESFFGSLWEKMNSTFAKEDRWKLFVEGTGITLLIALLAAVFGTLLGFALYLADRSGNRMWLKVNGVIGWVIGNIPSVLLLMILYYVVFVGGISIGGIGVAIIGFTILFGYTVQGLIETSVLAVGKGQFEAASALGYTPNRTFFDIILPQASGIAFPQMKKEVTSLIKETSIVGYIAVSDLTRVGDVVRGLTLESFFPLITTTVIYFLIIWVIVSLVEKIEFFVTDRERRIKMIRKGIRTK